MKKDKLKVLTLGHLPKDIGGKQHSGLAIGIWNIANTINKLAFNEIDYFIASTDIHNKGLIIDYTTILGWDNITISQEIFHNILHAILLFIKSIKLFIKFRMPIFNSYAKLIFLNRSYRIAQPDIMHFNGVFNFILFLALKKTDQVKIIITLHGIVGDDQNIPKFRYLKKMEEIVSNFDFIKIIFITNYIQKQWVKLYGNPKSDGIVIYPGINYNAFNLKNIENNNKVDSRIILCTVAGIGDRKGQKRVIEALAHIPNKNNFHYICIGLGKAKEIEELEILANKNSISFEIIGPLPQVKIKEYIVNSDYMILPSSSEGFGAVYIESIACGIPVIIPATLPLAHEPMVLNEYNSLILKDHSSSSIAECLQNLGKFKYTNEEVAGSIDFQKFTWEYGCKKYIEIIYKGII